MFEIKLNHCKQWVSSEASLDWICFSTSFCKEIIKCNGFKQSKWHVGWENRKASLKKCQTQRRRNYHAQHWRPYHFHISSEVLLSKARSPVLNQWSQLKKIYASSIPEKGPVSAAHCVNLVCDLEGEPRGMSLDFLSNVRRFFKTYQEEKKTSSSPQTTHLRAILMGTSGQGHCSAWLLTPHKRMGIFL